jgi:hypothetical protein
MQKSTSFGARKILTFAAISYIRAGRNVTPTARKNKKRDVKRIPGGTGRGGWPKFGIVVLSQKRPPKIVPVTTRKTSGGSIRTIADVKRNVKMAKVPHIGAGKNSWNGVFGSLNRSAPKNAGYVPKGQVSHGFLKGSDYNTSYHIFNDLTYLLTVAPEVDKEGRRRAARDITFRTENMVMKNWARKAS